MPDTIQIKRRLIDNAAPTTLADGELALNAFDMTLYAKDKDGVIKKLNESFPSGTKMMFVQTAAPTGWTKDTTHDNKALRVVSGTASTGGSVAFTTAFASQGVNGSIGSTTATNIAATQGGTVGNTTLATSQIPSHTHTYNEIVFDRARGTTTSGGGGSAAANTGATGGGGAHNHGFSGSSHNHTQNAHNHSFTGTAIDMAVSYVDVIIATKD